MQTQIKYIFPLLLLTLSTSISSCASGDLSDNTTLSPTPNNTVSPGSENSQVKSQQIGDQKSGTEKAASANSSNTSGQTVPVTVFTSDAQCQDYVSKQVAVPAEEPMNAAVGKVLEAQDSGDFTLAGYRTTVNNGVATIDLRVAPESKRQIASLSNCEQFAIFGSIRKTLTSNTGWNIQDVRFTQGGEEIVF